ncbi:MAG: XRE family aerobic/anaerobic benzoate catabolism transcriptional regulator [Planctomycetota bacterium]|jgi:XRE family aerobic/anaerobic benzoate catabolism transcriptional regulator
MSNILLMLAAGGYYKWQMRHSQELLSELARRVRNCRAECGLSVSELARRAEISRRMLTEIEAGRANPSILKLAALSEALGVLLSNLCDLRVSTAPPGRIALVGLRGAGKTTIGRRLAMALEAPFVELDRRVEELAGMPLSELFALEGMDTFRRLESQALEIVLGAAGRQVIATSGSIVDSADTFERLRTSCRTLWLRATPEEHLNRVLAQGDRRPVEGHPQALIELKSILTGRESQYARCDFELATSGLGIDAVMQKALDWI